MEWQVKVRFSIASDPLYFQFSDLLGGRTIISVIIGENEELNVLHHKGFMFGSHYFIESHRQGTAKRVNGDPSFAGFIEVVIGKSDQVELSLFGSLEI